MLQAFLERLESLLAGASQALRNSVALIYWQAFFDAESEPIQLFPEKRFLADSRHLSGEIYNFWSWQYTYRNQEHQKLRAVLEPFLHGSGPISIVPCVPVSNLKEYQTITGRLKTGDGLGQGLFAACNQAIDAMAEKFGYFPAWPIVDYTSEFILERMLSGQFHYCEGKARPPLVNHEGQFQLCPRDAARCALEGRKMQAAGNANPSSPSAFLTVLPLSSVRNCASYGGGRQRRNQAATHVLKTGCASGGLDYQAERWRYHGTLEALPQEFRGAPTVLATPTREPHAAYVAYMRQILNDVPDTTPDRLNASIACVPPTWPEPIDRDWRRYAQRMTACAFGMEGDTRLARGLTAKAKRQEQEKAETQPRSQGERQTTAIQEEKEAPRPVQRIRMR